MEQYIDKAAVVAKIEDWRDKIRKGIFSIPLSGRDKAHATLEYEVLGKVINFLDTLETEKVDLEKELNTLDSLIMKSHLTVEDVKSVAKHFFELGLKVRKGE